MKVFKWGNSLAVRLPADIALLLNLKAGDVVSIVSTTTRVFPHEAKSKSRAARKRLAWPLPR
jgi:antitoxin MazE